MSESNNPSIVYGEAYLNVSGHVLEIENSVVPNGHVWNQLRSERRLSGEQAENRGYATQKLIDLGYLKRTTHVPFIPSEFLLFEARDEPDMWFSLTPEVTETPVDLRARPQLKFKDRVWIHTLSVYGRVEGINTATNEYQVRYTLTGTEYVEVFPFLDLFLASYYDGETTFNGIQYDSWFGYSYTTKNVAAPDPEHIIDFDFTVPKNSFFMLEFPGGGDPSNALIMSISGSREHPYLAYTRKVGSKKVPLDVPLAVPASSVVTMILKGLEFRFGIDKWGQMCLEKKE